MFHIYFKPIIVNVAEKIFGDLNYDERVNTKDISILQRVVLGIYEAVSTEPPSIDADKFGGHWSPVSYQQFAELLSMIWSEYINTHVTEFQDVHLVPTK